MVDAGVKEDVIEQVAFEQRFFHYRRSDSGGLVQWPPDGSGFSIFPGLPQLAAALGHPLAHR